jgi:hypothetical protein
VSDAATFIDDAEAGQSPKIESTSIQTSLASQLPEANSLHTDLSSFLRHARRMSLSPISKTYLGTRYEYLSKSALQRFGFELQRTGKTGDRGVDLAGWWHLPAVSQNTSHLDPVPKESTFRHDAVGHALTERIRVLVQCKRMTGTRKLAPATIREMDGAFQGGPAGWRQDGSVLGIIVSTKPATKGVVSALGASNRGLVWICMEEFEEDTSGTPAATEASEPDGADTPSFDSGPKGSEKQKQATVDAEGLVDADGMLDAEGSPDELAHKSVQGRIIQLLYNNAARQLGLEGLDVLKRHPNNTTDDTIALVYRTIHMADFSDPTSPRGGTETSVNK